MSYAFDPELAEFAGLMPDLPMGDPVAARRLQAEAYLRTEAPDTTGVEFSDVMAPGPAGASDVMLRVYRPLNAPEGPLPAVLDMHGGGFMLGSVENSHRSTLELCRVLGAVIVSVEYRLAPENAYPAGLEDCYAGLVWLASEASRLGVDPTRVAVAGNSAGGGLAAGVTLLARDRGGPAVCFQYLGIPELDDRLDTRSMRAFTDTPGFNRPQAENSWDAYLGAGVRGTEDVPAYAAPARAKDLAGLPSAYISAMEFDPLRDEGIAYAQALLTAGVSVELHVFPGTFHTSAFVRHASVTRRQFAERTSVLRRVLHG